MSVPIHVRKPSDMPPGEHYAILKFSTVPTSTYEADDQATVIDYEAYVDRKAWFDEIERLECKKTCAYKAVFIKAAKVATKISVEVD
jgi:hypothetical protein